jgi:non-ribosomal peptide synthetase component F
VLLYKYSGQQDICVGSPIANRTQQELEGLIGFFVNTLALRSEVTADAFFTELLQQVKATTLEAYENQDVPFEKVVDAVVKERDQSRSPLFQVMFILQNTPEVPELSLGELKLLPEGHQHTNSKFELTFTITETSQGLQGSVEYCTDLFTSVTIERMVSHFTRLLTSVVTRPEQRIGALSMLTEAEQHQLLVEFNNTAADYPKDKSIVDLFEEQVEKTPGAIALVFEEEELSYQELNKRSNQLAHYLRGKGVKEETLVPICIERSIEMLVGILGILKAGGAYVPIDPEYPQERISYMLEDTKAKIVVSSAKSRSKLQEARDIDITELDTEWEVIEMQSAANLQTTIDPSNLAYVIYTSGSTGLPKGVMIEHRGVVSLVKGIDYISLSSKDILLSTGSSSFDAPTFDFHPTHKHYDYLKDDQLE